MSEENGSVAVTIRNGVINVLLVTAVVGMAAVGANMNKVCNSSSRAFDSIACTSDEFRASLKQLNDGFRPINIKILEMLDSIDNQYFDQNNTSSTPGSAGWYIKQILDRVNNLLDPNDFSPPDSRTMGGKVKLILDNLGELSYRLKALGNNVNDQGVIDLSNMLGYDVDVLVEDFHSLAKNGVVFPGAVSGSRQVGRWAWAKTLGKFF